MITYLQQKVSFIFVTFILTAILTATLLIVSIKIPRAMAQNYQKRKNDINEFIVQNAIQLFDPDSLPKTKNQDEEQQTSSLDFVSLMDLIHDNWDVLNKEVQALFSPLMTQRPTDPNYSLNFSGVGGNIINLGYKSGSSPSYYDTEHYRIHYTLDSYDQKHVLTAQNATIPDEHIHPKYIEKIGETAEYCYQKFQDLNYAPPPGDHGIDGLEKDESDLYDIYVLNLQGLEAYACCVPNITEVAAWIDDENGRSSFVIIPHDQHFNTHLFAAAFGCQLRSFQGESFPLKIFLKNLERRIK